MQRFIISTGRSGSTLLSNMVAQNRKVMVLSEFFSAMDAVDRFPRGVVTADTFCDLISSSDDVGRLIQERELKVEENIFDYSRKTRFGLEDMPTVVMIPFQALSDEPEKLFDEAIAFARKRPDALVEQHFLALFDFLADLLGKQVWVERSGFSMRMFPDLRRCFPDAKFLHIHREGMEAALSMYNHNWFVLGVQYDKMLPDRTDLEVAVRHPSKSPQDPIYRHFHNKPPLAWFGEHWTNVVARAYHHMTLIDRSQFTDLRFEDLVADPRPRLKELSNFLELPDDDGWMDRAAGLLSSSVSKRAPKLAEAEHAALQAACLPGNILLGRADPMQLELAQATLRDVICTWDAERKKLRHAG